MKITNKHLVIIFSIITVIAISVTVWAVFFRQPEIALAPDYAPQDLEDNAEPTDDQDDEKLDQEEGGGAVSLTYSTEVGIDLSDKTASLYFANPTKSNQDILVQIVIQDNVIVQSGLLVPGNKVQKLDLLSSSVKLERGVYEGNFNVLYYQQDSGEKAILNTNIPVEITVEE